MDTKDPCSCANFDDVAIDHMKLVWMVNFAIKTITGSVEFSCRLINNVDRIVCC